MHIQFCLPVATRYYSVILERQQVDSRRLLERKEIYLLGSESANMT